MLAKLRGVNALDRVRLAGVLGVPVPSGVEGARGVAYDSRRVEPGYAFVAVPGFKRDGVEFAPEAARRGASLVVAEREVEGMPTAVVPDARAALAALACAMFGDPSRDMEVYGVTGTNGKTTTAYALYSILAGAYGPAACGLMTTVETISAGERRPAVRTTPEAVEVQGSLAGMRDAGVRRVAMEVSSHGIALRRVAGTEFSGALFTNLTRDHLDLHGTMEEYYATKREIFRWVSPERPRLANAEDAWGRRLAGEVAGVKTFGGTNGADYRVKEVRLSGRGTAFSLDGPVGALDLETPLLGPYNVLNVAGAASLALEAGVAGAAVEEAVRGMEQVPGRFERVAAREEHGFEVIVDYAHTDVGLEAVLGVARGVAEARNGGEGGRVICVFGAAGERDGAKRPKMGRVAARLADASVITTDDAYAEDPEKIAREVAAGVREEDREPEIVLDRREAIRRALSVARAGDVVVVAGKGHERVQHLPEGDAPFHDATVVRELLLEFE
ncbi:MAG TPA: UDP-N-acetylmuramoyl-L-alanyl-D-glutamate--2,6-diaminopimelate ligase [Rubrobacteraceae bacterium]|nr:UDP-N-acetylmuramoyl-L-alanyl-D-glutamate--2,6-diaminopimelate ligase [Rubrobacteraceae bacterium]